MARVTDTDRQPAKHRVYEIVVRNLTKTKSGWRTTYEHTIKKDGWDEWAKDYYD